MGTTKAEIEVTAKDRTKAAFAQAEKGIKGLDDRIGSALKIAGAFAGTAGLLAVVKNSLSAADAIGKTAKAAGISAEALQELRFAADQSGVSTQQLDDGMRKLARAIGLAADGGGPAVKAFENLGIEVRNVNGQVRNTEDIFDDITRAFGKVGSSAEQAALASQIFGDDAGPKLALLLSQGEGGVDALREKAQELGIVLSDDMVASSEAANDKISQLEQVISSKVTKTVASNAEAIGRAAEALLDFVDATVKAIAATVDWSTALGESLSNAVHPAVSAVDLVDQRIESLNRQIAQANHIINNEGFLGFGGSTSADIEHSTKRLAILNVELQKQLEIRRRLLEDSGKPIVQPVAAPAAAPAASGGASNNLFNVPIQQDLVDYEAQEVKQRERLERQLAAVEASLLSEEQRMSESYVRREMMVEEAFANGLIEEERRKELLLELEQGFNDEITRIQQESMSAQEMMWNASFQGRMQVVSDVLGQVSNLMQSQSKKQFEIGKKAAIAQTAINTYQMAVASYNALASIPYVGPILGAIAAAAAIAYGKSQIDSIKSQSFGGGSVATGTYSANPNTGAPTGSPAGGSTSVAGIDGLQQQSAQPRQQTNVYIKGRSFSQDDMRDLARTMAEAAGDGVEFSITLDE